MAGTKGSCYDCKKRFIGCHSQCDLYKQWKQEYQEQKNTINSYNRSRNAGYYHK